MKKEIKDEETDKKDFDFILNRSKKILKIKEIKEPNKKINYTYTREENFSDDVIFHLTQLVDKDNQLKYKHFLSNSNNNSNFQVYDINLTTGIDVFFAYEYFKSEIYNNEKAYNVHENRKVPFEVENRHGKRRNYKNFEEKRFRKMSYNFNRKKNLSEDKYNKNRLTGNSFVDEENNEDKVMIGGIKEFKNEKDNYNEDNSMDNIHFNKNNKKSKKRKEYCSRLTTYDPFKKKKKKQYQEDDFDK